MDRFLKRVLIISLWLIVSSLDARAQSTDTETVTFQGAVIRHALSDKSIEVSGKIEFINRNNKDYFGSEEITFTIPAGQSSVVYSHTMNWFMGDGLNEDFSNQKVFYVVVECLINCQEGKVYTIGSFYGEGGDTLFPNVNVGFDNWESFGADERDDVYIVNLNLFPSYTLIETRVELPDGQVAEEDIQFNLVSEDHYDTATGINSWSAQVGNNSFEIKNGESGVDLQVKVDLLSQLNGFRDDEFYIGYQCVSAACDRAGLLREGWLGREQANMFTDRFSAGPLELDIFFGDDDFALKLPQPIQLFTRDNPVNVLLTSSSNQLGAVYSGKIIVEKFYDALFCTDDFKSYTEIDYSQDNRCSFPSFFSKKTIVSETEISFSANEQDRVVVINTETIKTDISCSNPDGCDTAEPSFQTIKFECTEGCSNQTTATRYLSETGSFSAESASSAKKFYQNEDFYEDDIILNFIQPPLTMPWLQLLMDEEAGTDVDTTAN